MIENSVCAQNPRSEKMSKILAGIQIVLIVIWLLLLRDTSSYYSIYVICAMGGVFCTLKNTCCGIRYHDRKFLMLLLFAVWFASTTVLANYKLFISRPIAERILSAVGAMLGGTIAGYQMIRFVAARIPAALQPPEDRTSAKFFLWSFCLLEGIYLVYLLGAAYPAYFTLDVFKSLRQITEGAYVNNNPFWYTMSIKWIAGIGYQIFGSANAAMAFYVFCQGAIMAAVFSYVLVTLYQIGVPRWVIAVCGGIYGLLPYNIAYSATMLKDIPFSIFGLLFVVSLYRILRKVGKNQILNYVFFSLGAFAFCLMRTNGLASFFVTMLVVIPLLPKTQRRVLVVLVLVILVLTWILTDVVLEKMDVQPTSYVEVLAIPFQQIGRVIAMGYELDPEDYELLDRIFDMELIPEIFMHGNVDPMKGDAITPEGKAYLKENLKTYADLWLRMAVKYPGEYVKAWIEQTKGYWNGGYQYWVYVTSGAHPDFQIFRPETMPLKSFFERYFPFVENLVISRPFYSIGLHVWLMFGCIALNIKEKRTELVLAIPGLIIILGLWLGTPVYSEFRYAYPMILSIPLLICTTIYQKK